MRRCGRALVVLAARLPWVVGPGRSARADPPVPVVLLPGWHGDPASFVGMIPALEAAGLTVLDFDPARSGRQALSHAPTADGQHIPEVDGRAARGALRRHRRRSRLAAAPPPRLRRRRRGPRLRRPRTR